MEELTPKGSELQCHNCRTLFTSLEAFQLHHYETPKDVKCLKPENVVLRGKPALVATKRRGGVVWRLAKK